MLAAGGRRWCCWLAVALHPGCRTSPQDTTRHWVCIELSYLLPGEGGVLDCNTARCLLCLLNLWVLRSEGSLVKTPSVIPRCRGSTQLPSFCCTGPVCARGNLRVNTVQLPWFYRYPGTPATESLFCSSEKRVYHTANNAPCVTEMGISGSLIAINTDFRSILAECF